MNNLNFIFLEEYKQLDKLCSELFDGQPGVTSYINEMKGTDWSNAREVLNWKTDLNNLIRLRHIRNHLAHTEGAFEENLCTGEDVKWVKDFRNRIFKQIDPLASLRKSASKTFSYKHIDTRNENASSFWQNLFFATSVILVAIAGAYLLFQTLF